MNDKENPLMVQHSYNQRKKVKRRFKKQYGRDWYKYWRDAVAILIAERIRKERK